VVHWAGCAVREVEGGVGDIRVGGVKGTGTFTWASALLLLAGADCG
jgi:hypothetical protein